MPIRAILPASPPDEALAEDRYFGGCCPVASRPDELSIDFPAALGGPTPASRPSTPVIWKSSCRRDVQPEIPTSARAATGNEDRASSEGCERIGHSPGCFA